MHTHTKMHIHINSYTHTQFPFPTHMNGPFLTIVFALSLLLFDIRKCDFCAFFQTFLENSDILYAFFSSCFLFRTIYPEMTPFLQSYSSFPLWNYLVLCDSNVLYSSPLWMDIKWFTVFSSFK